MIHNATGGNADAPSTARTEFTGYAGRECGEHRTVGAHRAWCHDCSEWCYPEMPCKGCELPKLRAELSQFYDLAAEPTLAEALGAIREAFEAEAKYERLRDLALRALAECDSNEHGESWWRDLNHEMSGP